MNGPTCADALQRARHGTRVPRWRGRAQGTRLIFVSVSLAISGFRGRRRATGLVVEGPTYKAMGFRCLWLVFGSRLVQCLLGFLTGLTKTVVCCLLGFLKDSIKTIRLLR